MRRRAKADVTLVDRGTSHLFQPLLGAAVTAPTTGNGTRRAVGSG